MRAVIFYILLVSLSVPCFAQVGNAPPPHILNFSSWKSLQITEADNRAVRLSNRIKLVKDGSAKKVSDINKIELEFRVAKNAAQVVRDLTIEDYFNVYLSHFLREPGTIEAAAHNLTPQEVTLLLKMYLSSHEPSDQASNL